eukprot:TRINITY_DN3051_c0_g1_i2.p1 TRINITY_DN3051_c0_g1~~TRINITY_DN3051_c0_g1_i2.p1  ORF type:complete len:419 (-),score=68.71 TRINITY_DN3051_c0_g1_i2:1213-2469(-)
MPASPSTITINLNTFKSAEAIVRFLQEKFAEIKKPDEEHKEILEEKADKVEVSLKGISLGTWQIELRGKHIPQEKFEFSECYSIQELRRWLPLLDEGTFIESLCCELRAQILLNSRKDHGLDGGEEFAISQYEDVDGNQMCYLFLTNEARPVTPYIKHGNTAILRVSMPSDQTSYTIAPIRPMTTVDDLRRRIEEEKQKNQILKKSRNERKAELDFKVNERRNLIEQWNNIKTDVQKLRNVMEEERRDIDLFDIAIESKKKEINRKLMTIYDVEYKKFVEDTKAACRRVDILKKERHQLMMEDKQQREEKKKYEEALSKFKTIRSKLTEKEDKLNAQMESLISRESLQFLSRYRIICSICRSDVATIVLIPCGHAQCQKCPTNQTNCSNCSAAVFQRKVFKRVKTAHLSVKPFPGSLF